MENVFIVTTIEIDRIECAGAVRLMNIARAQALQGVRVFLCSSAMPSNIRRDNACELSHNIFLVGEARRKPIGRFKKRLCDFTKVFSMATYLLKVVRLAKHIDGRKVFYLYPTTEASMDFMAFSIIRVINHYTLFYEVNELRRAGLHITTFSKNAVIVFYQAVIFSLNYIKFCIVEILTVCYSGLVVISTSLERYFRKYNTNMLRIPILVDVSENRDCRTRRYRLGGKFHIGFFGQIRVKKEGFDLFYKALSIVKSRFDKFEFHLYGSVLNKHEKDLVLSILPTKYGIKKNVLYHGIIERDMFFREMKKHHLLVSPQPSNLMTKYNFSTKLTEYLISGVPVLTTDVSDNHLYIKDGYNGFIVPAGDTEAMASKILDIIFNYNDIAVRVSANARKTAQDNFDYIHYSKPLYSFFFNERTKCASGNICHN